MKVKLNELPTLPQGTEEWSLSSSCHFTPREDTIVPLYPFIDTIHELQGWYGHGKEKVSVSARNCNLCYLTYS
jgi:hypothetical protein